MTKYFIETPDGSWLKDPDWWADGKTTRDPFKAWAFPMTGTSGDQPGLSQNTLQATLRKADPLANYSFFIIDMRGDIGRVLDFLKENCTGAYRMAEQKFVEHEILGHVSSTSQQSFINQLIYGWDEIKVTPAPHNGTGI